MVVETAPAVREIRLKTRSLKIDLRSGRARAVWRRWRASVPTGSQRTKQRPIAAHRKRRRSKSR